MHVIGRKVWRLLAFALGGALGALIILFLFEMTHPHNRLALGVIAFPASLLPGVGLGLLDGIGFEIGLMLRKRIRWNDLRIERARTVKVIASLIAMWLVLGAFSGVFGGLRLLSTSSAIAVIVIALALTGLAHGVIVGIAPVPGAFIGGMTGALIGSAEGFVFGLGFCIAAMFWYTPAPCIGHCLYPVFPVSWLIGVVLIITSAIGVGVSVVYCCASIAGLKLSPPSNKELSFS